MHGRRGARRVTSTLVAREFVELAKADNPPRELMVLKLISLTYLAHGRSFAKLGAGLIGEPVLVWPYGPAFRDLYGAIRAFGNYPVTNVPVSRLEWKHQGVELTVDQMKVIESVYDEFKDVTSEELIKKSTKPGTPWHDIWEGKVDPANQKVIDDRQIRRYFAASNDGQHV